MRLDAFKLGCRILRDPNEVLQEAEHFACCRMHALHETRGRRTNPIPATRCTCKRLGPGVAYEIGGACVEW